MRTLIALSLIATAILPGAATAYLGDVVCDDRARLEQQLASVHGAEKQGQGVRGPDALMEVWISPATGDWALVQAYANGTSCIVAMGDHWTDLTPAVDPA